MDKSTHQVRMAYWKSVIEQCNSRPTEQSARSWLRENNISDKQYYYWQRIIRKEAYEQMTQELPCQIPSQQSEITFAEFSIPESAATSPSGRQDGPNDPSSPMQPDAVIKTANGTVAFSNTTSSDLVRSVLEVMLHA